MHVFWQSNTNDTNNKYRDKREERQQGIQEYIISLLFMHVVVVQLLRLVLIIQKLSFASIWIGVNSRGRGR